LAASSLVKSGNEKVAYQAQDWADWLAESSRGGLWKPRLIAGLEPAGSGIAG